MKEPLTIQQLRMLIRLLGNPLDLAHPARTQELLQPFAPEHLKQSPTAWNRLGRYAVQEWKLKPVSWTPDESELSPILLASSEQLLPITQWLGILSAYHALQKTIRGDVIRLLHEKLPHCLPAVYRQISHFQPWLESLTHVWHKTELTPDAITDTGLTILTNILSQDLPAELMNRWLLQFPPDACNQTASPGEPIPDGKALLLELHNRGLILC